MSYICIVIMRYFPLQDGSDSTLTFMLDSETDPTKQNYNMTKKR